jgi:hypothetical protein
VAGRYSLTLLIRLMRGSRSTLSSRVMLRRNIVIDAETAQLAVAAVQAALEASAPSWRPRRRPPAPAADSEPLF